MPLKDHLFFVNSSFWQKREKSLVKWNDSYKILNSQPLNKKIAEPHLIVNQVSGVQEKWACKTTALSCSFHSSNAIPWKNQNEGTNICAWWLIFFFNKGTEIDCSFFCDFTAEHQSISLLSIGIKEAFDRETMTYQIICVNFLL